MSISEEQQLYGAIIGYGMIIISIGMLGIAYRLWQYLERIDE
tara:strand:+ start:2116 stop:2241 length:126 start_codon:yes stop_codon:yes gene_type:complete